MYSQYYIFLNNFIITPIFITVFKTSTANSRVHLIDFRLPSTVKPIHYDLYLHPDLKKGTFDGRVSILIEILEKRSFIVLHQQDLNIDWVGLYKHELNTKLNSKFQTLKKLEIKESYSVSDKQFFVVVPDNDLDVGRYDLKLSFNGSMQNKIFGLYSSKYKDEFNNTR